MIKYYLIAVVAVLLAIVAQLLLKKGAMGKKTSVKSVYLDFYTLLGYAIFVSTTIMTVYALKGIEMKELVFIFPLSYVMVPFLAIWLFNEKLSRNQIKGVVIILVGIIIFNFEKIIG